MAHKHLITHFEFSTKDLEGSKKFYSTVLLDGYDIPGVGCMATFKDPTGKTVALLQPLME